MRRLSAESLKLIHDQMDENSGNIKNTYTQWYGQKIIKKVQMFFKLL